MQLQTINYKNSCGSLKLFQEILKWYLELNSAKHNELQKGKLEMRNFTTEDDTVEAMNEDDVYRYLGHMQAKQIKHAQMKQKLGEEYINRTKKRSKDKVKKTR